MEINSGSPSEGEAGGSPTVLSDKLAALTKDFQNKMGERVVELKTAAARLRRDPGDTEVLDTLRMLAHNLAGAGATFGYDEVSKKSKKVELLISAVLKEDRELLGKEQADVQRYLNEIEEISTNHNAEDTIGSSVGGSAIRNRRTPETKKTIFLVERDEEVAKDLSRQLGYFGYAIRQIDRIEELTDGFGREDEADCLLRPRLSSPPAGE